MDFVTAEATGAIEISRADVSYSMSLFTQAEAAISIATVPSTFNI
jgi:hypothetical protein